MADQKVKRKHWQLSASSIATFKACPYQYFLKYIKRIRREVQPGHFRMGTNWHTIMEILSLKPGEHCACVINSDRDPNCLVCEGTGKNPDDLMLAAMRVIDDAYSRMPASMDPEEWAVERAKLMYGAAGYRWYYQNNPLDTILREYKFDVTLPGKTGRALANVNLLGFVDKLAEMAGGSGIVEHKTTSSQIDSESRYWGSLNLDTQTTMYLYVMQTLQKAGLLPECDKHIGGFIYDVFHKPTISPKMLTMGDSKQFVDDGMYFEQKFDVDRLSLTVDGVDAEMKPGKKEGTFAIRETPNMYGARLLADIAERPEFYFARREVAKTDAEIDRFHNELLSILATMKSMHKTCSWYHCEKQCEATYKCDFIDICYNGVDPDGELPEGLVRKVRE